MQNTKVTIKNIFFAVALAAVVMIAPQTAHAGGSTWSDADYDYYLYDSTPSYSSPSYSYPSYSYDSYTPSYSYDYYQPSSSSYSPVDYPSYSYDYAKPAAAPKAKSTAKADAKSYSYVYSENKNTVTSNNTNNNNNQNINTNNVNVVVYGGGGFATTTYNNGGQNSYPQLIGDCQASPSVVQPGQNVSFQAYATGGTGSYTYQWSGADGLSAYGQSFSGRFYSVGTKYVYVQITSGSQTVTRTCSVEVRDNNYVGGNFSAYCIAEPQTASVGQTVTWRVYTTGTNNNNYGSPMTYNWTGTDGLTGSGQYISRSYNTSGTKTAYVTVYANGQTYQAQCNANVYGGSVAGTTYVPPTPTTGTPVSGVFLSQLPATGLDEMMAFKNILIATALIIWAAFMAYVVNQKKRRKHLHLSQDRVAAFKAANLAKRS